MTSNEGRVPDREVPAKARTYSASYKAKILAEYEQLDKAEKGALSRREGLYTSLIGVAGPAPPRSLVAGRCGRQSAARDLRGSCGAMPGRRSQPPSARGKA
ncbi:hypothetical protein GCM10023317_06880 [Actinopolymorpha pittospori]